MKQGDLIRDSYLIGERLGRGLHGQTWAATATDASGSAVRGAELVVKTLALSEAPDWKALQRIENEAAALKAMSHPAIPRYVDSFTLDDPTAPEYVLVMERVPGKDLAAIVDSGRRFTESEIERMIAELLEILAYIHSLRPPIIHRDVNPRNVMLKPDGSVALVDFSGVQDALLLAYRDSSTMIGSAGYAPLEQVSGRASTRSDLYAAAATAAFLLTRTQPSDLPVSGLRIDPGAIVEPSPRLAAVFASYLDPDEARRSLPALEAAAILRGTRPLPPPARGPAGPGGADGGASRGLAGSAYRLADKFVDRLGDAARSASEGADEYGAPEPEFGGFEDGGSVAGESGDRSAGERRRAWPSQPESLPSDSRVALSSSAELFSLSIPRTGLRSPSAWFGGGFALFWLGFVAVWTFAAISMGAPIFFALFSLPFWAVGIFMVRLFLKPVFCSTELTITEDGGLLYKETFIGKPSVKVWPLADIGACRVDYSQMSVNGRREREVVIETGSKTLRFGRALSEREKRAITASIQAWLAAKNT